MRREFLPLVAVIALMVTAAPVRGRGAPEPQDRPLPSPEPFFTEVRSNLVASQGREKDFSYKERRTQIHMNPFGRIGTGAIGVYDVTPSPDGSSIQRRLIEMDGAAVVGGPVEKIELRNRGRGRDRGGLDDVMQVLQFTIDRREKLDGHTSVVVRFVPRPDAKPHTREGRIAQALEGQIWIDEGAREIEKVEARAIDTISFGFGLLARLSEGTDVSLVRKPVGNTWMPTSLRLNGAGRALVVRKLTLSFAVDWFDYRPITR